MAAQRPVAAQIVSVANAEDTSAKALSRILASDVALASRVMKLANSAYFGMRGRVASLQFAVTVVGFTTVRTMATVALTDLDDESRLPEDFWARHDQPGAGRLHAGPPVRRAPAGRALHRPARPDGRRAAAPQRPRGLRARSSPPSPTFTGRRAAEIRRYGLNSLRLTSVALEQWGFPHSMTSPLQSVDDYHSLEGGLLRAAFEVAVAADHRGLRARADRPAHLRPAPRGRPRAGAGPGARRRRRAPPGDARPTRPSR